MALNPDTWLDEHGDALYRYAVAACGRPDLAEDLVQETLLAAWSGRDGYRGRSSERTWLIAILKHKVDDHFRRRTPTEGADDIDDDAHFFKPDGHWALPPGRWACQPVESMEADQFWRLFSQCLHRLPERLRDGFALRELANLGVQAVCELLEVTENNFYVLMHRCRLRLRACLESGAES